MFPSLFICPVCGCRKFTIFNFLLFPSNIHLREDTVPYTGDIRRGLFSFSIFSRSVREPFIQV